MQTLGAQLQQRFPSLSTTTANKLWRAFIDADTLAPILAASDAELLAARGFGRVALDEFRAVWPRAEADGWREHAQMVAGGVP